MGGLTQYRVMREHLGDRFYTRGDLRILDSAEARNLVRLGVLLEEGGSPLAKPTGMVLSSSASQVAPVSPKKTSTESDDGEWTPPHPKAWKRRKR